MQRLAGHVGRLRRGQIDRRRGHVLGGAELLGRDVLLDGADVCFSFERIGHGRGDEARSDAVDGDAARGHLARQRLRHADHAGLGGGIVALAGVADDAADGGDVDDAAIAGLGAHHGARAGAHQHERRGEVDGDHLVPLLVLHHHEQVVLGEPGVVDEDVERGPSLADGLVDQLGHLRLVAEIAGQTCTRAAELGGELLELVRSAARRWRPSRPACAARARWRRRCRRWRR